MSCEAIELLLALHVDDALTPTESQQVEAHLESCPDCQLLVVELRENQARLKSLPVAITPSHFREDLLREVTSQNQRKRPTLRYLLPRLSSLAAALLVVLLASNLYLFPLFQSAQLTDDLGPMSTTLSPPQLGAAAKSGIGLRTENVDDQMVASLAEQDSPDHWFWSILGAVGLFGLGSAYFVFRYRHLS